MTEPNVCLLHAPQDRDVAAELKTFLELGCDRFAFFLEQTTDFLASAASNGLSGDVLILLLSPALGPWPPRQKWEPILVHQAADSGSVVVGLVLEDCSYPKVLQPVFRNRRVLKRWLWKKDTGDSASTTLSPDLEPLYLALSDQPGSMTASGSQALRFLDEASQDFARTALVPCAGRTPTQILSSLTAQLGLEHRGRPSEFQQILQPALDARILVVFDAPDGPLPVERGSRSSFLVTTDSICPAPEPETYSSARALEVQDRVAEAYEAFERLAAKDADNRRHRREMASILYQWGDAKAANLIYPEGGLVGIQTTLGG